MASRLSSNSCLALRRLSGTLSQLQPTERNIKMNSFSAQFSTQESQMNANKMLQFNLHADAYQFRKKINYPENFYSKYLITLCTNHESALDICCGNGVSTIRLKPYFKYVEGHDMGDNLISNARINYPDINFCVNPAEKKPNTSRKFDLVTCATAFYWTDRRVVLENVLDLLNSNGVFCAYKYDFPKVYGPIQDLIDSELVTKWSKYRDKRLTDYDDTLECIERSNGFVDIKRHVEPNILVLKKEELALFFLSTSYVTKYIDKEGGVKYIDDFISRVVNSTSDESVYVNFDIHAYTARKKLVSKL